MKNTREYISEEWMFLKEDTPRIADKVSTIRDEMIHIGKLTSTSDCTRCSHFDHYHGACSLNKYCPRFYRCFYYVQGKEAKQ